MEAGDNLRQAEKLAHSRALVRCALLREMHIGGVLRGRRGFAFGVCMRAFGVIEAILRRTRPNERLTEHPILILCVGAYAAALL